MEPKEMIEDVMVSIDSWEHPIYFLALQPNTNFNGFPLILEIPWCDKKMVILVAGLVVWLSLMVSPQKDKLYYTFPLNPWSKKISLLGEKMMKKKEPYLHHPNLSVPLK